MLCGDVVGLPESGGSASVSPRLDLVCLTDDPMTVPRDERTKEGLDR